MYLHRQENILQRKHSITINISRISSAHVSPKLTYFSGVGFIATNKIIYNILNKIWPFHHSFVLQPALRYFRKLNSAVNVWKFMTHNQIIDITEQLFTIGRLKRIKNLSVKTVINWSSQERPWVFVWPITLAWEVSAKNAKPKPRNRNRSPGPYKLMNSSLK